ncbi:MAG: hypothetical protein HYS13_13475 [Planctomycetia bacterium]|nr:hypothetical protein [Planctomycetia bacterium]
MIASLIAAGWALAAAAALWRSRRRYAGTTLIAPIAWGCAALLVLAGVEVASAFQWAPRESLSCLRYLATCGTFAPGMALLGAKRPQDRAWQFVVLTLLAVLALPVVQSWAISRGEFQVHAAMRWLLIVPLLALGILNGLPTRHSWIVLFGGAGQALLFLPYFPEIPGYNAWQSLPQLPSAIGVFLMSAAVVAWAGGFGGRREEALSLDRVWREFRDGFGAAWALRVVQQFNQSAAICKWSVVLRWRGLEGRQPGSPPELSDEERAAVERSLRTILRRFVGEEWIEQRLGKRRTEATAGVE